jgi:uncharacterized protein YqeY
MTGWSSRKSPRSLFDFIILLTLYIAYYSEDVIYSIMAKLLKQRKESIKSYLDGGRSDLAETEQMECDVISSYLPKQLSTDEVDRIVCDAIVKLGATTVKDMGKVLTETAARIVFP